MNVYAIQSETGPVKIGVSANPKERLKLLTNAQPFGASIIHVTAVPRGKVYAVEAAAHAILKEKRQRGEWFNVTKDEAVAAIEEAVAAVDRGETVKQMLRLRIKLAEKISDDAVRRLIAMVGKKLIWRDVAEITGISTATLRRHYKD